MTDDFEEFVAVELEIEYPEKDGWDLEEQPVLPSGARPDFVLMHKNEMVVVDAKDKQSLTSADVRQVADYTDELDADEALIYIASDTEVSDDVEELADELGVDIVRTDY